MAVASILAQKGREVVTAPPDRSLQDVATILAERKIGAIVITNNNGKVLGMLSERDIVRAMAREGASALDDPVSRHMTERVITIALAVSFFVDKKTAEAVAFASASVTPS